MTTNRQFSLADVAAPQLRPLPAAPNLTEVLAGIGSLPREALFLGMAQDGLPILLNLYDSVPGPLLIIGSASSGKTTFLHMIVHVIQETHRSEDVQFGVITSHMDEWKDIPPTDHAVGVFSAYDNAAQDFLLSLAGWAHANRSKQSRLLLIDDLESVTKMDAEALQNLRWLLLRGPSHRAWPIVTMNVESYDQTLAWISMFRTRIFGKIENRHIAEALGADPASGLEKLEAGQFALRENGNWLQFWLPSW